MRLYPSRILSGQLKERDLFNLAPDGVYRAPRCYQRGRWALTLRQPADSLQRTPFHPYPGSHGEPGGLFSVALSLGLPLVAISHRPALRSSDFPPHTHWYRATTLPALSKCTIISRQMLSLPACRLFCSLHEEYDIYYNI
jgi:hypothetical protein